VSPRSPAEIRRTLRLVGSDLALDYGPGGAFEDADLVLEKTGAPRRRDLVVASGVRAATQALANRLKTRKGELRPLGHPDYGSRHHELVGKPNTERTRNLIKLYVLEALSHEPRLEKILECRVFAPHDPPRERVDIELTVRLAGEPAPELLVVPFLLGGSP